MATYSQINERLIPVTQYISPTTGNVVDVNGNGCVYLIIDPESSLLALTLNFPSSPEDGDIVRFTSSQTVVNLTMTGGIFDSPLSTFSPGDTGAYIYKVDSNSWHSFT